MLRLTSCHFFGAKFCANNDAYSILAEWNVVLCLKLAQTVTLIQNVSLPIIGTISIRYCKTKLCISKLSLRHVNLCLSHFIKRNNIQKNTLLWGATRSPLVMLKWNFHLLYARHTVTEIHLQKKERNISIFCEMKTTYKVNLQIFQL